jgi:Ion channel
LLSQLVGSRLLGWCLPCAVILVEPAGSEITAPGIAWWYVVVTAATVGHGDLFPVSAAGHMVGTSVVVGGTVALTLLFGARGATLSYVGPSGIDAAEMVTSRCADSSVASRVLSIRAVISTSGR